MLKTEDPDEVDFLRILDCALIKSSWLYEEHFLFESGAVKKVKRFERSEVARKASDCCGRD